MAAFSLATGLRAANVTGLQWSQVDLARRLVWIHPDQAKARKAIPVPLNAEAVALLSKQIGEHQTHVFSYCGKPVVQVSTKAWYDPSLGPTERRYRCVGILTCSYVACAAMRLKPVDASIRLRV
jgi:integrase